MDESARSARECQSHRPSSLAVSLGGLLLVIAMGGAITAAGNWVAEQGSVMAAAPIAVAEPQSTETAGRLAVPAPEAREIASAEEEALPRGRESGWERAAPRPPLGPSELAPLAGPQAALPPVAPPEAPPGEPQPTLLFRPVAPSAGRIEAAGHVIDLDGVEVLAASAECDGSDGQKWPCGAVARAAFRAWLRGRAVECKVSPAPLAEPVVSTCRIGREDAAAWLVSNGYAVAVAGGAYEQAGTEAKAARRGIFGDRPHRVAVTLEAGDGISALETPAVPQAPPLPAAPEDSFPPAPAGPEVSPLAP